VEGPLYLYLLAQVHAQTGNPEAAFATLDQLFKVPGFYNEHWVQRDPGVRAAMGPSVIPCTGGSVGDATGSRALGEGGLGRTIFDTGSSVRLEHGAILTWDSHCGVHTRSLHVAITGAPLRLSLDADHGGR
jgi:hypothetical protein